MKISNTKLLLLLTAIMGTSLVAMADGNAFTPLNFDDASYYSSTPATPSSNGFSNAISKVMPVKKAGATMNASTAEIPVGNDNIQNAILELDNAQVGIRNDLLNYKAKYADVDAQYKLIKNERSMLHKQVRSIERRINNIDKSKERIKRNMI